MRESLSMFVLLSSILLFFFFNDTATTEIYTLSLHDALPISTETVLRELARSVALHRRGGGTLDALPARQQDLLHAMDEAQRRDRKSTRLNSSHANISYAVFCLKKKNKNRIHNTIQSNSCYTR